MNNGMIAESLPTWLTNLHPRFQESGVFDGLHPTLNEPNHCLVNEYLAGQGILVSCLSFIRLTSKENHHSFITKHLYPIAT